MCFSTLLGNGWLLDDHINMMMEELSQEAENNTAMKTTVIIVSLTFAGKIKKNRRAGTYDKKEAPLLRRYEKHINEKGLEKLVSPVHINNNHWIAVFVDFKAGKIGHGKSRFQAMRKFLTFTHVLISLSIHASTLALVACALLIWIQKTEVTACHMEDRMIPLIAVLRLAIQSSISYSKNKSGMRIKLYITVFSGVNMSCSHKQTRATTKSQQQWICRYGAL